MTMTQTEEMTEADEHAFYGRIDRLYSIYEDWTGDSDDEAAPKKVQSNGEPCVEPPVAVSTFAVFTSRLAVDFGMSREDFIAILGTMYDNEVEAEGEDGGDEPVSATAGAPPS